MALRAVGRWYQRLLVERPLITNFVTAGGLGAGGDLICQHAIEGTSETDEWRTVTMTTFCSYYQGVVCYVVYRSYDSLLPAVLLKTQRRAALAKSCVDNFVHVPFLYMPSFYLTVGMMQGDTLSKTLATMQSEWLHSVALCAAFWVPLQALNFGLVPSHGQVLFVNVGCLIWNIILSSFSQASKKQEVGPGT